MTEEEEDYDELPPITVNSSARDSCQFSMPCARELAEQRAREELCEQELLRLREDHAAAAAPPTPTESIVTCVAHSDSSGSEGEAALAAAVTALRVRAAAAPPPARPPLAALLAAAAPLLPRAPFFADYASAVRGAPQHRADAIAEHILESVGGVARSAWEAEEALCACAWLCLALAGAGRGAARLARTAHLLLDELATEAHADALAAALLEALPDARARLELADALRCGGERADALAGALVDAALRELLAGEGAGEPAAAAAAWRRLGARDQYVALQMAGRARARGARGAERLLAALVAAAAPSARDHRPDTLKVLVAASKLQVLFQAKK